MTAKVDYEQVLERCWELANLTASETKGSITGQLHALELLWEELRRKPEEAPPKPQIYQAEWMRK